MIFRFTVAAANARNDRSVHQVYGSHPAKNVAELAEVIRESDVILVEEIYAYSHQDGRPPDLENRGPMIINWNSVVKIDSFDNKSKQRAVPRGVVAC